MLLAVFPRGERLPNPLNDQLVEVNKTIAKLEEQALHKRATLDVLSSERVRAINRLAKLQTRILQLKARSEVGRKMLESWGQEIST